MDDASRLPDPDRTCRSCSVPITFALTPEGKRVPLDRRAPVYVLHEDGTAQRVGDCFVTHFATCPKAGSHSRRR